MFVCCRHLRSDVCCAPQRVVNELGEDVAKQLAELLSTGATATMVCVCMWRDLCGVVLTFGHRTMTRNPGLLSKPVLTGDEAAACVNSA